jgi:hypothetical protein
MILQLNKDADNPAIKEAAGRNGTHGKRVTVVIPLNEDGTNINASITKQVLEDQLIGKIVGGV